MAGKKDLVKDEDRFSIITEDLQHCFICGRADTELHEIIHGTAYRKKSKQYGLVVPLCLTCHSMVHRQGKFEERLKRIAELKYIEVYSKNKSTEEQISDFIQVFGKNYLDDDEVESLSLKC